MPDIPVRITLDIADAEAGLRRLAGLAQEVGNSIAGTSGFQGLAESLAQAQQGAGTLAASLTEATASATALAGAFEGIVQGIASAAQAGGFGAIAEQLEETREGLVATGQAAAASGQQLELFGDQASRIGEAAQAGGRATETLAEGITSVGRQAAASQRDLSTLYDQLQFIRSTGNLGALGTGIGQSVVSELTNVVLKAAAVVVSFKAVKDAIAEVNQQIQSGRQLADLAQSTGIAAEELSKLKFAAEVTGTSFEGVSRGVGQLVRAYEAARDGSERFQEVFQKLGIATDQARSSSELLQLVADKMAAMGPSAERTALAMELFGRNALQLLPFLAEGGEGLGRLAAEAEKVGRALSGEQIKNLASVATNLSAIQAAAEGLATQLAAELAPGLSEFLESIRKAIAESGLADAFGDIGKRLGDALASAAKGESLGEIFADAISGGIPVVLDAVTDMVGQITLAIAAAAPGIALSLATGIATSLLTSVPAALGTVGGALGAAIGATLGGPAVVAAVAVGGFAIGAALGSEIAKGIERRLADADIGQKISGRAAESVARSAGLDRTISGGVAAGLAGDLKGAQAAIDEVNRALDDLLQKRQIAIRAHDTAGEKALTDEYLRQSENLKVLAVALGLAEDAVRGLGSGMAFLSLQEQQAAAGALELAQSVNSIRAYTSAMQEALAAAGSLPVSAEGYIDVLVKQREAELNAAEAAQQATDINKKAKLDFYRAELEAKKAAGGVDAEQAAREQNVALREQLDLLEKRKQGTLDAAEADGKLAESQQKSLGVTAKTAAEHGKLVTAVGKSQEELSKQEAESKKVTQAYERQQEAIKSLIEETNTSAEAAAQERQVWEEIVAQKLDSAEVEERLIDLKVQAAAQQAVQLGANEKEIALLKETTRAREEDLKAVRELQKQQAGQERLKQINAELNYLRQAQQGLIPIEEAYRQIAIDQETINVGNRDLATNIVDAADEAERLREQFDQVNESVIEFGERFADTLADVVFEGEDLGEAFKNLGKSIGRDMFKAVLTEKLGFDQVFKANIFDLGKTTQGTLGGAFQGVFDIAGQGLGLIGNLFGLGGGGGGGIGIGGNTLTPGGGVLLPGVSVDLSTGNLVTGGGGLLNAANISTGGSGQTGLLSLLLGSNSNTGILGWAANKLGLGSLFGGGTTVISAGGTAISTSGTGQFANVVGGSSSTAPAGEAIAGGGFSGAGAFAGALGGFQGAQLFGGLISDTGLPARLANVERSILKNAQLVNTIMSTIVGAAVGGLGGGAGGIIGLLVGAVSSIFGKFLLQGVNREALRERTFQGTISENLLPMTATAFLGPAAFIPAVRDFLNDIGFGLLGIPTLGTAYRREAQRYLAGSEIFGPEGPVQAVLGPFSREDPVKARSRQVALERGLSEQAFREISAQGQALFGIIFGEGAEHPEDAGRIGLEMGQLFGEYFSRGIEEGMTVDEALQFARESFRGLAREAGVDVYKAFRKLGDAQEQVTLAAKEFTGATDTEAQAEGINALGESAAGLVEIFEQDFPQGTQLGLQALLSLEKDGKLAFEGLNQAQKEWLLSGAADFNDFAELWKDLAKQGYTVNQETFEKLTKSAAASAQFIGENWAKIFEAATPEGGVQALTEQLKAPIKTKFLEESTKQLFDKTAIATSFQPVFDVLDRAEDFDLKTPEGLQEWTTEITNAIAEGKGNLQSYLPQIKAQVAAWKEVDKAIDEALAPTKVEEFFGLMAEQTEQNLQAIEQMNARLLEAAVAAPGREGEVTRALTSESILAAQKQAAIDASLKGLAESPAAKRLAELTTQYEVTFAAAMEDGYVDAAEAADLSAIGEKMYLQGLQLAKGAEESGKIINQIFDNAAAKRQAEITAAVENAKAQERAILSGPISKALTEGIVGKKPLGEISVTLGEDIKAGLTEAIIGGMADALINAVVVQGFLAPFLAFWDIAVKDALSPEGPGGKEITPAEREGLRELATIIVEQGGKAVEFVLPFLEDLIGIGRDAGLGPPLTPAEKRRKERDEQREREQRDLPTREERQRERRLEERRRERARREKEELGLEGIAVAREEPTRREPLVRTIEQVGEGLTRFARRVKEGLGDLEQIEPGTGENVRRSLEELREGFKTGIGEQITQALAGIDPGAAKNFRETLEDISDIDPTGAAKIKDAMDDMAEMEPGAAEKLRETLTRVGGISPQDADSFVLAFEQLLKVSPELAKSIADSVGKLGQGMSPLAQITAALTAGLESVGPGFEDAGAAGAQAIADAGGALAAALQGIAAGLASIDFSTGGGGGGGGIVRRRTSIRRAGGGESDLESTASMLGLETVSSRSGRTSGGASGRGVASPPPRTSSPGGPRDGYTVPLSPHAPKPEEDEEGDEEKEFKVSFNYDAAIADFFAGGTEQELSEAISEATGQGLIDGLIAAIFAPEVEKMVEKISELFKKAKADGVITPEEMQEITTEAKKFGAQMKQDAKELKPIVKDIAKDFGVDLGDATSEGIVGGLSGAIEDFWRGGTKEDLRKAFNEATFKGVVEGMINALILSPVMKKYQEEWEAAYTKAMEDGTISIAEGKTLSKIADRMGDDFVTLAEYAQPGFQKLAKLFGVDIAKETKEALPEGVKGGIAAAFRDSKTPEEFLNNVRKGIYEHVLDALIQAFIADALIQGALAPFLAYLDLVWKQVAEGKKTREQGIAETRIILGYIHDETEALLPLFAEFAGTTKSFASDLGYVAESADTTADAAERAADAAEDVSDATAQLETEMVELGKVKADILGATAQLAFESLVPAGPDTRKISPEEQAELNAIMRQMTILLARLLDDGVTATTYLDGVQVSRQVEKSNTRRQRAGAVTTGPAA